VIRLIPRTTVDIGNEELEAIKKVFESGQFVKGKEAENLEKEFSKYQNVKEGATVNSGTSALHLSLLALDVQKGDEIILPPNTFAATVNAIILAGGKPVFVDVNSDTFTIDHEKIENSITSRTKGIIPVHLYGLMCEMGAISDIAKDHELFILEDACQSHGAEYFGKRAGEIGDIAAFSFFPTKNTTVAGDGGIAISNNLELIEKIKALRDHGRIGGEHKLPGLNNRLSEILAAVGRIHLTKLDSFNNHRRKIAEIYNQEIIENDFLVLPVEPQNFKHVYHLYTLKTKKRALLQKYLKENNVGSKVMYKEKLNELEYVRNITEFQPMPINSVLNSEILSLPISGTLDIEKIKRVCSTINTFFD